jgi:integrase
MTAHIVGHMKSITVRPETRHDGGTIWRVTLYVRKPHEAQATRVREGFATAKAAEDRRKELLTIAKDKGESGLAEALWGVVAARVGDPKGLDALVERFLAEKEAAGRRERTLGNLRHRLDCLLKRFGDRRADSITGAELQSALDALPLSPRSRINMALVWQNLFRWARRRRLLKEQPMEAVEKPSAPRGLPGVLPPYPLARLVAAAWYEGGTRKAPGPMLPYALLTWFSAIRPDEVQRLRWEFFNLEAGLVVLDERVTKVSMIRMVHLMPELVTCLKVLKRRKMRPGLFSRRAWDRIRQRAGVDGERWVVDMGRHTYASSRYAIDHDEAALSADMGNSVAVLRKHYINRLVDARAAARWRLVLATVARRLRGAGRPRRDRRRKVSRAAR